MMNTIGLHTYTFYFGEIEALTTNEKARLLQAIAPESRSSVTSGALWLAAILAAFMAVVR